MNIFASLNTGLYTDRRTDGRTDMTHSNVAERDKIS